MRQAEVHANKNVAGILTETDDGHYIFKYSDAYLIDNELPAISLAFPKRDAEFASEELFPFFFNMLSEGENRAAQSRTLKIDEKDYFGLLLATAKNDTIGAITLHEL